MENVVTLQNLRRSPRQITCPRPIFCERARLALDHRDSNAGVGMPAIYKVGPKVGRVTR
jgi:hypothetical protein